MLNQPGKETAADRAKRLAEQYERRAQLASECGARDTAAAARRSARLLKVAADEVAAESWVAK